MTAQVLQPSHELADLVDGIERPHDLYLIEDMEEQIAAAEAAIDEMRGAHLLGEASIPSRVLRVRSPKNGR